MKCGECGRYGYHLKWCHRWWAKGQERTLSDVAGNVPASKPYAPSIDPATEGSNACGEVNIAHERKFANGLTVEEYWRIRDEM